MDYIITCASKGPVCRHGYQHIVQVGYRHIPTGGSVVLYAPRQEMVEKLEHGQSAVTQGRDGWQASVVVRECACGTKYLTTKPDADLQDNLAGLPGC